MSAYETVSKGAIAGVVSGVCVRLVTSPLDVLKIRFQLQLEDIHHGNPRSRYHSIRQASRKIASEEGLSAFWYEQPSCGRGFTAVIPAIILQAIKPSQTQHLLDSPATKCVIDTFGTAVHLQTWSHCTVWCPSPSGRDICRGNCCMPCTEGAR